MSGAAGRVLVTGAAGYLGRRVTAALRARGDRVVAVGHGVSEADGPAREGVDLRMAESVADLVEEVAPRIVYHFAGTSTSAEYARDPAGGNVNVVRPAVNVLEAVATHAPGARVVLVSPAEVYGRPGRLPIVESAPLVPADLYAAARAAVEYMSASYRDRGVDVVVGRLFTLCGPEPDPRRVLGQAARAAARGEELRSNQLTLRRDVVDVRDVVDGLLLVADRGAPGAAYNLCSGAAHVLGELVEHIVQGRAPIVAEPPRPTDVPILLGSPARAEALGWVRRFDVLETLTGEAVGRRP